VTLSSHLGIQYSLLHSRSLRIDALVSLRSYPGDNSQQPPPTDDDDDDTENGGGVSVGSDNEDDEDDNEDDNEDGANPRPPSAKTGVISKLRTLVRTIQASSHRQDALRHVISMGNQSSWWTNLPSADPLMIQPRQLIRDVRTRWDSTYQMLLRAFEMHQVRDTL
jgi:hypothetical protein